MSTTTLEPYAVVAYNSAWDSENKIHDDEVARRFGFSGGLVPGVDVYAYMAHAPVTRWGRDFLARGTLEARFLQTRLRGRDRDGGRQGGKWRSRHRGDEPR